MRHIWLLDKALQQSRLRFGPLVEYAAAAGRAAFADIDAGELGDERVAHLGIRVGNAKAQPRLPIGTTRRVARLLIGVFAREIRGARRHHVHVFETDIDDVVPGRIRSRCFDIDAHHRVDAAPGKVRVTPVVRGFARRAVRRLALSGIVDAGQTGLRHKRGRGRTLGAFGFATFGALVQNVGRSILNVFDVEACGEMPSRLGSPQHHGRASPLAFARDLPQMPPFAGVQQQVDFVVQPTIGIGKRARQPI